MHSAMPRGTTVGGCMVPYPEGWGAAWHMSWGPPSPATCLAGPCTPWAMPPCVGGARPLTCHAPEAKHLKKGDGNVDAVGEGGGTGEGGVPDACPMHVAVGPSMRLSLHIPHAHVWAACVECRVHARLRYRHIQAPCGASQRWSLGPITLNTHNTPELNTQHGAPELGAPIAGTYARGDQRGASSCSRGGIVPWRGQCS